MNSQQISERDFERQSPTMLGITLPNGYAVVVHDPKRNIYETLVARSGALLHFGVYDTLQEAKQAAITAWNGVSE